ncbi:unnamed protein product, partial [marine sediment metagenome]
ARFCFVVFEDLEQDEAGDTLTHTFTWHGWETCQVRWFYFWATSEGEKMKSTSPIFSKHFVAPQIFTALCDTQDGKCGCPAVRMYLTAHDADGTWHEDEGPSLSVLQQNAGNYWWTFARGALVFDTIELPPSWKITKAIIHFNVSGIYDPGGGPLDFVDASGLNLPLENSSFEELRGKTSILCSIARDDIDPLGWYELEINPSKLSVIKPGQLTIIGVREHHDVIVTDGGQPAATVWGFSLLTCEHADRKPYLTIYGE